MLAGSRARSSQNCWIPSIPILFSSWGSLGHKNKYQEKKRYLKKLICSTGIFKTRKHFREAIFGISPYKRVF